MNLKASLARWLEAQWYDAGSPPWLLRGLEQVFLTAVRWRQAAYRTGRKTVERLPVPVIVVGNLTVGGTGKTPLTLWLAAFLSGQGYRPGIVSRGYGGGRLAQPLAVGPLTDPALAGDEPVLMARRSGCPVHVFPRRAEAARAMLAATGCDVILTDDGLQHYALGRDIEIAVVDGLRGFGNGHVLPAGPLREPPSRLVSVDLVVYSGLAPAGGVAMTLTGDVAVNLLDPGLRRPLTDFAGSPVHALAGIGNPERFFRYLEEHGLAPVTRALPDHHVFCRDDLAFAGEAPLLMTEKDAVKCLPFASRQHWLVPVEARLPASFGDDLLNLLRKISHGHKAS